VKRITKREFSEAAIVAELETGVREETAEAARSHIAIRVVRVLGGALMTLCGVALTVLPGPGVVLILAGLSVLAVDVPYAARLRAQLLERTDKATSMLPSALKKLFLYLAVVIGVLFSVGIVLVKLLA
jgi:hypothetical protein